jgi:hypothetical protein
MFYAWSPQYIADLTGKACTLHQWARAANCRTHALTTHHSLSSSLAAALAWAWR